MESTDKHKITVAIFVLIGFGLIFLSVMLIGGDKYLFRSFTKLNAKFEQVQGLFEGSVVSLAGLTVGNVSKITFDPNAQGVVLELKIDSEFAKRITTGSVASIQTQGALGDKYVYIKPGPPNGAPIGNDGSLTTEPEADLVELIKQRGPDFTHFMDAAKQLNILLTSINESGGVTKTFNNLAGATDEFKKLMSDGRGMVGDLRGGGKSEDSKLKQSMSHLANVMKKLDDGQGTLGALINDPSLHDKILGLVGDSPRNKFLKPLLRESIQSSEKK